jgi:hypothetical protein
MRFFVLLNLEKTKKFTTLDLRLMSTQPGGLLRFIRLTGGCVHFRLT